MKYFIDTEFIEGFHKPLFGKRRHFIDLISIGIVCEDGRTGYYLSSEYNYNDADKWVQENVILPLYLEKVHGDNRNIYSVSNFHKRYGHDLDMIKTFILGFVDDKARQDRDWEYFGVHHPRKPDLAPEFYAYYADYDWVVFCSLFGRMVDLPNGFPMYCKDLKQMLDDFVTEKWLPDSKSYMQGTGVDVTFDLALEKLKGLDEYPKQENEHSALDDAIWNMKLYNFLQTMLKDVFGKRLSSIK